MSSNMTCVNRREWDERLRRIASTEAYVIRRKEEAARIAAEATRLRAEIENNRIANQQAIQRTINSLRDSFNDNVGRLRGQLNTAIRAQSDTFAGQIDSLQRDISNVGVRITGIDQRINAIADSYNAVFQEIAERENDRETRANVILSELSRIIDMMESLDPARFTPTEYARVIALRESIRSNINSGDYQAAILVSQESVLQATRLLARLQIINDEYNRRYAEIVDRATSIREHIGRLSSKDGVLTSVINGEETDFDYDVSFWSRGQFDSVASDFYRIDSNLRERAHTPEQLEQIDSLLDTIENNIEVVDQNARRERFGAIAVVDTATQLYNGMLREGMSLERAGYQDDDERNPYVIVMDTEDGGTVSVVVSPESPESPSIFMEVFSEDEYRAAATKDGLHAALEEDDILVTHREVRDDCHVQTDPQTFIANALDEAHERLDARRN